MLLVVMIFAYFMASIPHLQNSYPLHVDEWMRYGDAQSLLQAGYLADYPDPFEAGKTMSPDIEEGYHLLLAELKLISGISWLGLFRFVPGLILALLAFKAYVWGKGGVTGLASALLVTLIPTTTRFLGPAFLVPVSLGLAFIPLVLIVLNQLNDDTRLLVILCPLLFALLFIHPPTFAVVSAITLVHFMFSLPAQKSRVRKHAALWGIIGIVLIYVFMVFWAPSFVSFVTGEAMDPARHLNVPPVEGAIAKIGYIPMALFALGIGFLAYRNKRENWALLVSAIGMLAFQLIYPRFYIGPDIVYERGWLYIAVLVALIGGMALTGLGNWIIKSLQNKRFVGNTISYTLSLGLIFCALGISLKGHFAEPYYHLVDDIAYQDFLWIKEKVPSAYNVGVLDTGVAWAFACVTEKYTYTSEVAPNFHDKGRATMLFLNKGITDTRWIEERGISIVYTRGLAETSGLIKAGNNIYLFREKGGPSQ